MKKSVAILLFFPLLIHISGCDEPVSGNITTGSAFFKSESSPYELVGTVLDSDGKPVKSAAIHFMMKFSASAGSSQQVMQKTNPSTQISFSVNVSGPISLRIFRLGTREYVATLIDTVLSPGTYSLGVIPGALSNGFYIYQLITNNVVTERLMIMQYDDAALLEKTTPVTRTNSEGKFILPYGVFGLDEEILVTGESSPTVIGRRTVDSIAIVVFKSGTVPLVQWMHINKNSSMEYTYILQ